MSPDETVAASVQDTTRASPGRTGPPRTFLGAIAVVGASICIVLLLLVASGASFWTAVGIPVIILAALAIVLMHVFATIGRSLVGRFVVGFAYVAIAVAILGWAPANDTAVVPGPAIIATAAFIGGGLTLLGAGRRYLRDRAPPR